MEKTNYLRTRNNLLDMKIMHLSWLILTLFPCALLAQYTYTIKLKNIQGLPLKNTIVTAENESNTIKIQRTTDASGTAVFELIEQGTYTFSYLTVTNASTLVVKEGMRGQASKTVTYDPDGVFKLPEKASRQGIEFSIEMNSALKGQKNIAQVNLEVKQKNGTRVANVDVVVVDIDAKKRYVGKTNASGVVAYYLPVDKSYEVDVAGLESLHQFKVPNWAGAIVSETIYYEPTKMEQQQKGDTIIQQKITQTNGTTSHLLYTLNVKNYEGQPLSGEEIFIDAVGGETVYKGITDDKGVVKFMLLKGNDYLVNFKYDRGVCLVSAIDKQGFASAGATRRYRGSQAIEKMLAEREVNKKGFVTSHSSTPVRQTDKPINYFTKTAVGFTVNFESAGPVGTPTIAEEKLFVQAGYHSPKFYAIHPTTGQYFWGVELGESGASPAVYHNGVLLINTYSCTLYALDAATGQMLWSKWLAGTIYSTPSADGNSVYAVYDNGHENPFQTDESFVLASFDLKTGKVNWMTWIDDEVIASPIVIDNEIHLASQSGTYYVVNKESGNEIRRVRTFKALTSPTITNQSVYLVAEIGDREHLIVLDRKTFELKKKYTEKMVGKKLKKGHDAYLQMNYVGSRPIIYKNKWLIMLADNELIAFDIDSEREKWRASLQTHPNQSPLIMNDKVIVATQEGKVISFDLATGASKIEGLVDGEIDGQPIVHNGWMYLATAGVLQVIKTSVQSKWQQWNKNAQHNSVFE
jgi:outer membrane protein assembly factor BamB